MLIVDHSSCFVQRGFPSKKKKRIPFFYISKVYVVFISEVILKDYYLISVI